MVICQNFGGGFAAHSCCVTLYRRRVLHLSWANPLPPHWCSSMKTVCRYRGESEETRNPSINKSVAYTHFFFTSASSGFNFPHHHYSNRPALENEINCTRAVNAPTPKKTSPLFPFNPQSGHPPPFAPSPCVGSPIRFFSFSFSLFSCRGIHGNRGQVHTKLRRNFFGLWEGKSGVCGVVASSPPLRTAEGGMGTDFSVAFSSLVAEITLAVVYTGCPRGKRRGKGPIRQ